MNRPTDEQILDFLSGTADAATRDAVLAAADQSPDFAAELRRSALGFARADDWARHHESNPALGGAGASSATPNNPRVVSRWWVAVAAAATLVVSFPMGRATAPASEPPTPRASGVPVDAEPSYVVVLQGRWPDAGMIGPQEGQRRASEYWGWADRLAASGRLVAAGDLSWEAGPRLMAADATVLPPIDESVESPDFLVGMFAIRASSYDEALAIARECPHLRYGGSVTVRQVSMGFVTMPGMDDWSE